MAGPEKKVEQAIIKWLESYNGIDGPPYHTVVYKIHGGSQFQKSGIPDILCSYFGHFVAIEVKRPDGKGELSTNQIINLIKINMTGGIGIVAKSLDEVKQGLSEHGIYKPNPKAYASRSTQRITQEHIDGIRNV